MCAANLGQFIVSTAPSAFPITSAYWPISCFSSHQWPFIFWFNHCNVLSLLQKNSGYRWGRSEVKFTTICFYNKCIAVPVLQSIMSQTYDLLQSSNKNFQFLDSCRALNWHKLSWECFFMPPSTTNSSTLKKWGMQPLTTYSIGWH